MEVVLIQSKLLVTKSKKAKTKTCEIKIILI